MRHLFSTVISAGLLASHLAAAQSCARTPEKAAFDVAGLKSQLMVTAITCKAEEKYNAFVTRFRPDLVSNDKTLSTYFTRSFGRRAQAEHDDYITSLANAQSQSGIKVGTAFCDQTISLFDEAMRVKSGTELATLAGSKSLVQPIVLIECAPASATTLTRTAAVVAPVSRKH